MVVIGFSSVPTHSTIGVPRRTFSCLNVRHCKRCRTARLLAKGARGLALVPSGAAPMLLSKVGKGVLGFGL